MSVAYIRKAFRNIPEKSVTQRTVPCVPLFIALIFMKLGKVYMIKLWNGNCNKMFCIFLLCLLFCIFAVQVPTNALYATFKSSELSEKETEDIINNISFERLTKEPKKKPLECFDVNINNEFAIGFSKHNDKTVLIYDENGIFQYGYAFKTNGSFYLKYDKLTENLVIFSVRGQHMITVNETGIVRIDEYKETADTGIYLTNEINVREKRIDDYKYEAKNKISLLSKSYSELERAEKDGLSIVLYKADGSEVFCEVIIYIIGLLFWLIIAIFLINKKVKDRKTGAG